MGEYETMYPERVTRGEDGVYRWTYDMDMWRNRFLLGYLLKLVGIIVGVLCLFMLLLFYMDGVMSHAVVGICLLIWAGLMLLTLLAYCVSALIMRGHYRIRFEMDDTAVRLVRLPSTNKYMKAVSAVNAAAAVASVASGEYTQGVMLGANAVNAAVQAAELFGDVKKIKEYRRYDAINLVGAMHGFQIWIPGVDYLLVKELIEKGMKK